MMPCIESYSLSIQVNVLFTQLLVVLFQCSQSMHPLQSHVMCLSSPLPSLPCPAATMALTCRMGRSPPQPLAQQFSVSLQLVLSLQQYILENWRKGMQMNASTQSQLGSMHLCT